MKLLKILCYIFVAVLHVSSGMSTKSKAKDIKAISSDGLSQALLSPSPSTSADYSSRQGDGDKKENDNEEKFKPSHSHYEYSQRVPAPLASNSSTDNEATNPHKFTNINYNEAEEEKPATKEDSPQGISLKLLDDEEGPGYPGSEDEKEHQYEGRNNKGKFPRIYYGDVSPHYSAVDGDRDHVGHSVPIVTPDHGEHDGKYFYPKQYAKKPKTSNKKKRFEYKHEEGAHEHHQNEHGYHSDREISQTPEGSHGHGPDYHHGDGEDMGKALGEEQGYFTEEGHKDQPVREQGYGHPEQGYHHHGSGWHGLGHHMDVIGKALQVLIPSALLLTGVSALFPNRLHVPTNDYVSYQQNLHVRQKRSLDSYGSGRGYEYGNYPRSRMLEPEHRMQRSEEDSPMYPYLDTQNYQGFNDFSEPEDNYRAHDQLYNDPYKTSEELYYDSVKDFGYGQKLARPKKLLGNMFPRPSFTQDEYNSFNTDPHRDNKYIDLDSSVEPTSQVITSILPGPEESPIVDAKPDLETTRGAKRPSKRIRVRVRQGIRGKNRSRPLPSLNAASTTTTVAPTTERQSFTTVSQSRPETTTVAALKKIISNEELAKAARNSQLQLQELLNSIPTPATVHSTTPSEAEFKTLRSLTNPGKGVDLSADGPVMGLITSYAQHDKDSPECQKRALCELALKGKNPSASRFETFLWSLATLVPDQFSQMYELEDIFKAIKTGDCNAFRCADPNLDIQQK